MSLPITTLIIIILNIFICSLTIRKRWLKCLLIGMPVMIIFQLLEEDTPGSRLNLNYGTFIDLVFGSLGLTLIPSTIGWIIGDISFKIKEDLH